MEVLSHPITSMRVMNRQPCSIEGCDAPREARGWCKKHYSRWHRHGDPVKVTRGFAYPSPNPSGLCGCGCGLETKRATSTSLTQNIIKGEHLRFIHGHEKRKGGFYKMQGRWMVSGPQNKSTGRQNPTAWARVVMERHIGRPLLPKEVVHHINANPEDDRIENLMLFPDHSSHMEYEFASGQRKRTIGCRVDDCEEKHFGHGFCSRHLKKYRRGTLSVPFREVT